MTATLTPSPRGGRRMPDHSGIRLPLMRRRFVPERPGRDPRGGGRRFGGPPLRAA